MTRMPLRNWFNSERSGGGSVVATARSPKKTSVFGATFAIGAELPR